MTAVQERATRGAGRGRVPVSNFWAKVVMAVTGLIFVAYVFVHMYGNLHIFYGPESFDHYAHWLRTVLEPLLPYEGLLWILRVVLLVSLLLHVACAVLLWARARRAGPVPATQPGGELVPGAHDARHGRRAAAVRDLPHPGSHARRAARRE